MSIFLLPNYRGSTLSRIALSYYVTNGLSAAVGLFLISGGVRLWMGPFAAAVASIGVICVVPPDQPAPRRGKFWQVFPAVLVGIPLFTAVRILHLSPVHLGLLLIPATFIAFLAAAWGRRGIPVSMSAMFAMIFALAVPSRAGGEVVSESAATLFFSLGAVVYVMYATLVNSLLNGRYRVALLGDVLLSVASMMRTQARQFTPDEPGNSNSAGDSTAASPIGRLMREQAALADQLQTVRDLLLESPRTPLRQQWAGMLVRILEMRDQLLACELDVDLLVVYPAQERVLNELRAILNEHAEHIERLADCLLARRNPPVLAVDRARLENLPWSDSHADMLARGLAARVRRIGDEISNLYALARREAEPELAVVRASWHMFVSPTTWSWQPIKGLWHWDAPPLRHAIRAALAIGIAYTLSLMMPWGTHAYWILLTIVVVLRGSLAQTLERRNSRVAGTLVGTIVAGGLFWLHAPGVLLMLIVTLAQGVAHAFAVKRYLVTAVAATVLALLQAHLLNAGMNPTFEALERVADTIIGVGVAWAFSYVLPAWERKQIPALISRTLQAQARHARLSLELAQLIAVDNRPELEWRLARRETYDSLSALVQATQRCLAEPRAVRPPLEPLGRFLAHSYQLLAQLTAVKTMLLLRRGHLDSNQLAAPLQEAMARIGSFLAGTEAAAAPRSGVISSYEVPALPDPFGQEVTPWLLRRLTMAVDLSEQLSDDARLASSSSTELSTTLSGVQL